MKCPNCKHEVEAPDEVVMTFGDHHVLYIKQHIKEVSQGQSKNVEATSMSDLVTPKQLGMIRYQAREAGVDMDEECQRVNRCKTEDLSKRAASSFIDHLKSLQKERARA